MVGYNVAKVVGALWLGLSSRCRWAKQLPNL